MNRIDRTFRVWPWISHREFFLNFIDVVSITVPFSSLSSPDETIRTLTKILTISSESGDRYARFARRVHCSPMRRLIISSGEEGYRIKSRKTRDSSKFAKQRWSSRRGPLLRSSCSPFSRPRSTSIYFLVFAYVCLYVYACTCMHAYMCEDVCAEWRVSFVVRRVVAPTMFRLLLAT